LQNQKTPAAQLAGKKAIQNETIEASIPAGNKFAVMLTGARKRTDVRLKITGR